MAWLDQTQYAPIICPWSLQSIGTEINGTGGRFNLNSSGVWQTANLALFVPFWTGVPITARKLFTFNGAVVSGNVDVGIYTPGGVRLVSAGSTAQAGTSALQVFDIADTVVGPGLYYMALALNNTTGTFIRSASNNRQLQAFGCFQMATAFPLPATATFASVASAGGMVPAFGLSTQVVF